MNNHRVGVEIGVTSTGNGARVVERDLDNVERQARELRTELDRVKGLDPKVRKEVIRMADSMERAAKKGREVQKAFDQVDGLNPRVRREIEGVANSMNKVRGSSRNSGLAVLEFSRAVEDAQYGLRGILNNIPQLILLMGGGGGLAGVISLAAVGISQLFTSLSDAGEDIADTSADTQKLVDKFREMETAANEARFDAFVSSLDYVRNRLELQNVAFRNNIELMATHQQHALAVAAAQANLQRAQIAQRVISDENYTQEDAARELAALRIEEIQLEGRKEIAEAQKKELEAQRRVTEIRERIAAEEEAQYQNSQRHSSLRQRFESLQAKQSTRDFLQQQRDQALEKQADEDSLGSRIGRGFFNISPSVIANGGFLGRKDYMRNAPDQEFIDSTFSEKEQGEFEALKDALGRSNDLFKDSVDVITQLRHDLAVAEENAETISDGAEAARQNTEIVTDINVSAEELRTQTEAQKKALEEGNQQMRDILKDGIIDAQERVQIAQTMQKFKGELGLANSATFRAMEALLLESQLTRKKVEAFEEVIKRLQTGNR